MDRRADIDAREAIENRWLKIRDCLEAERRRVYEELRNYPPPIAGCDLHYRDLAERRDLIAADIRRLDALRRENLDAEELRSALDELTGSAGI